MLQKLAKQLNAYDEASLMQLWQTYANKVKRFEPTREWEEATLIFSFIQAIKWKNQLFNYKLAELSTPDEFSGPLPFTAHFFSGSKDMDCDEDDEGQIKTPKKAKILRFPAATSDEQDKKD